MFTHYSVLCVGKVYYCSLDIPMAQVVYRNKQYTHFSEQVCSIILWLLEVNISCCDLEKYLYY